jgi:hypothetical protein
MDGVFPTGHSQRGIPSGVFPVGSAPLCGEYFGYWWSGVRRSRAAAMNSNIRYKPYT